MECKIIAHGYEGPVVTDQFHQKKNGQEINSTSRMPSSTIIYATLLHCSLKFYTSFNYVRFKIATMNFFLLYFNQGFNGVNYP